MQSVNGYVSLIYNIACKMHEIQGVTRTSKKSSLNEIVCHLNSKIYFPVSLLSKASWLRMDLRFPAICNLTAEFHQAVGIILPLSAPEPVKAIKDFHYGEAIRDSPWLLKLLFLCRTTNQTCFMLSM